MLVTIPYGQEKMSFEVPDKNLLGVLWPNPVEIDSEPLNLVKAALDNPIGTPFPEVAGKRVAIICEDGSRPTPTHHLLEPLVDRVTEMGGSLEDILVVMALGSHRPMSPDEIRYKVGDRLLSQIRVVNSEFRDKSKLKFLGIAPGGVPIWADKRVVEADVRIGVGTIVPHPAVGWSGGGKIIYPGVTAEETVTQFHLRHGRTPRNMFGEDNSPVRLEMEDWVDTVGLDFIVNAVATPEKEIYRVVAGHYVKAHREGVKYAKQVYQVSAPGKADIAVVSSAPADADFWQGGKGILAGDRVLNDGGTLILLSPCYEGIGPHPQVVRTCSAEDPDAILNDAVKSDDADVLGLAVGATIGRIRKRIKLRMVTKGMTAEEVESAGITYHNSIEAALSETLKDHGEACKVVIIPYGGETMPVV